MEIIRENTSQHPVQPAFTRSPVKQPLSGSNARYSALDSSAVPRHNPSSTEDGTFFSHSRVPQQKLADAFGTVPYDETRTDGSQIGALKKPAAKQDVEHGEPSSAEQPGF